MFQVESSVTSVYSVLQVAYSVKMLQIVYNVTGGMQCCRWYAMLQVVYRWCTMLQVAYSVTGGIQFYRWHTIVQVAIRKGRSIVWILEKEYTMLVNVYHVYAAVWIAVIWKHDYTEHEEKHNY